MTIQIADTFEVRTAAPIDGRMVIDSYSDLEYVDELVTYEGMVVYTLEEQSRYILIDGNFVLIDPVIYEDGENGYMLTQNAVTAISNTITTDDLPEGEANKYFTDASLGNALGRQQFLSTTYSVLPNDHYAQDCFITTNFQLMQIEADAPCRVRIYASEDGRNNDTTRAFGAAVDPDNGMFVDFVITTPNTVYNIAPSTMVFSESDSEFSPTYTTITNLDVTQKDINVTLTYVNFGIPQIQIPT